MLELFVDKSHFFKFLSMSNKPQLHQLKKMTKRGSSNNESLYTPALEKVTRDVSFIIKYQQDQMILIELMYSIKET